MNKLFLSMILLASSVTITYAQSVGINTTTPQSKLDVNGDLALRGGTITLSGTVSDNIDLASNAYSFYNVQGTGFQSIAGIFGGKDGRIITLHNGGSNAITVLNNASSVRTNSIEVPGGGAFSLLSGGSLTLVYNKVSSKWNIVSSIFTSGQQGTQWSTEGNANTYPGSTFIGTTDSADLVFKTAATEQMRITKKGNIGIGTTTPAEKLTLVTDAGRYGLIQTNGTTTVGTYINTGFGQFGTYSNHPLGFFTNNQGQQMTLLQNGNVGIGTTAPQTNLHINPNGAGSVSIGTNRSGGGYTNLEMGISKQSGGYGYVQATQASGTSYGSLALNPNGGRVGVGTTTPIATMDIRGGISLPIKVVKGTSYSVQSTDYTIVVDMENDANKNFIVYMPPQYVNDGRIIKIVARNLYDLSEIPLSENAKGKIIIVDVLDNPIEELFKVERIEDTGLQTHGTQVRTSYVDFRNGVTLQCISLEGWVVTDMYQQHYAYSDQY